MNKTAIIVPCFNEEKRLNKLVFLNFAMTNSNAEFWMLDDGSTDNTLILLQNLA